MADKMENSYFKGISLLFTCDFFFCFLTIAVYCIHTCVHNTFTIHSVNVSALSISIFLFSPFFFFFCCVVHTSAYKHFFLFKKKKKRKGIETKYLVFIVLLLQLFTHFKCYLNLISFFFFFCIWKMIFKLQNINNIYPSNYKICKVFKSYSNFQKLFKVYILETSKISEFFVKVFKSSNK